MGSGRKLVAYYSWGGNTKAVAERIAAKAGADLLELVPVDPYPADYGACVDRAARDGRSFEPELASGLPDLSGYDVVFAGSPCWWGSIANPLRTFLHASDLSGKVVMPFMAHGTSGKKTQDVKGLCPGATVLERTGVFNEYQVSTRVNTPDNMGDWEQLVDTWLEKLGL